MNGAIAVALARRELSVRWLAPLAALLMAGVALGSYLAGQGLLPAITGADPRALDGPASLHAFWLWILARALPLPLAASAVVVAIHRIADDHDSPWLATLVAGGLDRGAYVLAVVATVLVSHLGMYLALMLGFVGGTIWGGAPAAPTGGSGAPAAAIAHVTLRALLRWVAAGLPGATSLLASATAYGVACQALARRRGAALALALSVAIAPVALVGWAGSGSDPSVTLHAARLLALLAPLPDWSDSTAAMLRHITYCSALLLLLAWSAPRWVARHG